MPDPFPSPARHEWWRGLPFLAVLGFVWLLLILGGGGGADLSPMHYTGLHMAMEMAALVLAALTFFLLWLVPHSVQRTGLMALAVAVAVAGWLDFLHAMSYRGMPDLVTPAGAEKAIAFWLAGRAALALGLLALALVPARHPAGGGVKLAALAIGLAAGVAVPWVVLLHPEALPRTYLEGSGLTAVKIGAEVALTAAFAVAGVHMLRAGLRLDLPAAIDFALAALLAAIGELYFASYGSVTDLVNMAGHVCKVLANVFLCRGAYLLAVRQPLRELSGLGGALQATQNPSAVCDRHGRLTWTNSAYEAVSGRTQEQWRGRSLELFDLPGEAATACAQAMREGRAWQGQVEVRRANGEVYLDERAVAPMHNTQGYLTGFVVVGDDVTERQARVDRAEETAQRLRMLLDSAPDAVVVIDEHGIVQLANRKVEAMFGYPAAELLGCNVSLLMPRDEASRHDGYLARHRLTGEKRIIDVGRDVTARHRDGSSFHVHLTVAATETPSGPKYIGFMRDITERIHAARLLAERERRYRMLMDTAQDGVWIIDQSGCLTAVNEAYARMSGYTREQLLRMRVPDLEARDDATDVARRIAAVREVGHVQFESVHRRSDGVAWPVEVSASFWPEEDGQVFVFLRDLTQRKQAAEELRLSQERFQLALRGTNDGLWDRDLVQNTIYYSPRWKGMLGYADDELPNSRATFARLLHPEDALRAHLMLDDAVRQPDTERFEIELRLRHKAGHWLSVLSRGQAVRDAQGRAIRLIGTHQDLTERIAAERALRESEQKLRQLFELSPLGIALCTLDGRLVDFNEAYRKLFEHDAQLLRQLTYWDLTPAEYMASEQEQLESIHRRGRYGPYEKEYRRADGTLVPVRLNGVQLLLDNVPHIWSIVEDLTETRRLQRDHESMLRQQQQSQKLEALGHLTGGIAHDFNNMLAGIMGLASLGLDRHVQDPDSKLATYLREIVRTSERGRDLVAKMLAYARTEEAVSAAPSAVGPLVIEVTDMLKQSIPSGIRLDTQVEPDLPSVRISAVDVHQVVMNLVINARDAVGEHGRVRVGVAARQLRGERCITCGEGVHGRFVELSVADSGEGIADEVLPHIFDPFFTTKGVGKGTGLGLASVQGIVHKAGGHLLVRTSSRGTSMQVYLPADGSGLLPATEPPTVSAIGELSAIPVWVVDDDPAVLVYLTELLDEHGCRVRAFSDPRRVLAALQGGEGPPAVLISDQTMPGLSGGDLAQAVLAAWPGLPIILCTGYSERMDEATALRLGIRHFLRKPFVAQDLLDAVRAAAAGR